MLIGALLEFVMGGCDILLTSVSGNVLVNHKWKIIIADLYIYYVNIKMKKNYLALVLM